MRALVAVVLVACAGAPAAIPLPPVPADVERPPSTIAAGDTWACARTSADVRCWGYQVPGLSIEPSTRLAPERIPELDGATAIVGNGQNLCAVMPDATARCAGIEHRPNGKLDVHGHPFRDPHPVVRRITGVPEVVQLAVGAGHTCALARDGTVRCWGGNSLGELGDGTRMPRTGPVLVEGVTNVVEIAAGPTHTCARITDGGVRCWGGRAEPDYPAVIAIEGVIGATQIASGFAHDCARITDGTLRCWGHNGSGQLGDGTRERRTRAIAVTGLANVVGVELGDNHTCARLADGTLACWGDSTYGEVGPAAPGDVDRPEQVGTSRFTWKERYRPAVVPGLTDVVDVALGQYISCVRTRDGAAHCFGRNELGQIGPRDQTERPDPHRIPLD